MIEKVHANEYPLSDTVYALGRTYSILEHHKDFKQTSLGGQDGRKQENHLGENEQIKKPKQNINLRKNHRKGKKIYILTGQMMTTQQHIKILIVG